MTAGIMPAAPAAAVPPKNCLRFLFSTLTNRSLEFPAGIAAGV
jgi:hypothetical protein